MASYILNGAENLSILRPRSPTKLNFMGSSLHGNSLPQMGLIPFVGRTQKGKNFTTLACSVSSSRPASQPRFIQHKQEAFWFYRFLSIVYDHVINPGHWTEDMRDEALEPAELYDSRMKVVDVGGGTGFTTLGIIKHVDPKNVIILDQSPHQLEEARKKEALKECTIIEGDAEDLPFPTDSVDRYVSAGRDVVAGLGHLHELGIILRDIKPQNVLICIDRSMNAKLSYMGISKRLVEDMSSLSHHATGYGSSGWQAPEQLLHGRSG